MITVLENSQTKSKHTLNLIDNFGKVIGFNPYPNGVNPIRYQFRDSEGALIATEKYTPIEKLLIGSRYHFGTNISFVPSEDDGELILMCIELITDIKGLSYTLLIDEKGGNYCVEELGMPKDELDQLFSVENITKAKQQLSTTNNQRLSIFDYEQSKNEFWKKLTLEQKLDYLYSRISKLENKVNLLGRLH